ncbi:hypothetical protein LINPERHAP1_LOCUS23203 [Linum perenne]
MKIGWGLIDHHFELWARVLITKYLKTMASGYVLARKIGFFWLYGGVF